MNTLLFSGKFKRWEWSSFYFFLAAQWWKVCCFAFQSGFESSWSDPRLTLTVSRLDVGGGRENFSLVTCSDSPLHCARTIFWQRWMAWFELPGNCYSITEWECSEPVFPIHRQSGDLSARCDTRGLKCGASKLRTPPCPVSDVAGDKQQRTLMISCFHFSLRRMLGPRWKLSVSLRFLTPDSYFPIRKYISGAERSK